MKLKAIKNWLPAVCVAEHENVSSVGFKIPRFTEQLLNDSVVDDDYGVFPRFYNGEQVVFMLRECPDVVKSMSSLKYPDGTTWLDRYGRSILCGKQARGHLSADNASIFRRMASLDFPPYLVGALYWRYKTEAVFELVEGNKAVLPVVYEQLVRKPGDVLSGVVNFLGLGWDDSLLSHHRKEHSEVDANGIAIGGTNAKAPIHDRSVNVGPAYFSAEELQQINEIAEPVMDRLRKLGLVGGRK